RKRDRGVHDRRLIRRVVEAKGVTELVCVDRGEAPRVLKKLNRARAAAVDDVARGGPVEGLTIYGCAARQEVRGAADGELSAAAYLAAGIVVRERDVPVRGAAEASTHVAPGGELQSGRIAPDAGRPNNLVEAASRRSRVCRGRHVHRNRRAGV